MNMQIALTNLGKYNEGELVYTWLQMPALQSEIEAAFIEIGCGHINEAGNFRNGVINEYGCLDYEEYFISDYELPFKIGEYTPISTINEQCEALDRLHDHEAKIYAAIADELNIGIIEALDVEFILWDECDDMADVAYAYVEECGLLDSMPENLQSYFNYEAFGRDMQIEGHFVYFERSYIQILN